MKLKGRLEEATESKRASLAGTGSIMSRGGQSSWLLALSVGLVAIEVLSSIQCQEMVSVEHAGEY